MHQVEPEPARPHYLSRSDHSCTDMDEDDDSAHSGQSTVATEETLVVRYCLANLSEASPVSATRMSNSGLFMIMIKLICSSSMEVERQALRCMSAMCPAISSESTEKAITTRAISTSAAARAETRGPARSQFP